MYDMDCGKMNEAAVGVVPCDLVSVLLTFDSGVCGRFLVHFGDGV